VGCTITIAICENIFFFFIVLDSNEKSMRLMGATWLTHATIHVLFFPLENVASYTLDVVAGEYHTAVNLCRFSSTKMYTSLFVCVDH
jgi:hypothetical protein